jgi:hypothetical protein
MADKAEANTYGLPTGEAIRKELARRFRSQRNRTLVDLGVGTKELGPGFAWDVPDYRADTPAWVEAIVPILEVLWEDAGDAAYLRVGLDPADWSVTNPELAPAIRSQAFDLCDATNATTHLEVEAAYQGLRDKLQSGLIDEPAATEGLVGLVREVFLDAATWRARRIATTEASRAVHAAELMAARRSGIVIGFRWLLSSDACPLCQRVAAEVGAVRLGEPFAVTSDHATYGLAYHPPLHPHCQCTVESIVDPAYSGEAPPDFGGALDLRRPAPTFALA